MTAIQELKDNAEKLTLVNARRAKLIQYRSSIIVAALAEGCTWGDVREATGLSLRGVQLAIARAAEGGSR